MRQHLIPAIVSAVVAGGVGYGAAVSYKPKPTVIAPQTTVVSRAAPVAGASGTSMAVKVPCNTATTAGPNNDCLAMIPVQGTTNGTPQQLTRAEKRQAEQAWGDLDQKEIDMLTASLSAMPKVKVVIFCKDDAKCGDMQLDFENAFESAHWEVETQTPLIDDTVGVGVSSVELRDAINNATGGRLAVKIIQKNAPYEALAIGKKASK